MARKIVVLTLLTLLGLPIAGAQSLESFKSKLSGYSYSSGEVEIYESSDAKSSLDRINRNGRTRTFLGYRIGIFFDNGATARTNATEAKKLFEENFPNEEVYMIYENPYFKVSAGNCVTQEEAVMLLDKVQKIFPKAYLMREQLQVSDIIIKERSLLISEPIVDTTSSSTSAE